MLVSKTRATRDCEKTGASLAEYIERILPLVNNNTDGGTDVVEGLSHNAYKLCFQDFTREMRTVALPMEAQELEDRYAQVRQAALDCFDKNMPFEGQSYDMDKYKKILSERAELYQEKVRANNTYSSYRACMDMTRAAKSTFKGGRYATMAECRSEMEHRFQNVSRALRGPRRKECLRDLRADLEGCVQNMAVAFASERVDRLFATLFLLFCSAGMAWYLTFPFSAAVPPTIRVLFEYSTFILGSLSGCVFVVGKTHLTNFGQSDIIWLLDLKDSAILFVKRFFIVILIVAALLFRLLVKYRPKSTSQIIATLLATEDGRHIDGYEGYDDDDDDDDNNNGWGSSSSSSSDSSEEDSDDDDDKGNNTNEVWRHRREMVFFIENCGNPSTVLSVSRLLFRRSRRRRIILVIGWVHYLGLAFLPRNGVMHIVCSGPKELSNACENWVIDAGNQVAEAETPGSTENSNTEAISHIYDCVVDVDCMDISDKAMKNRFLRLRKHK